LNKQRKLKLENIVEKTYFIHTSCKAWNLLKKLGTDASQIVSSPKTVTANDIASRLLYVSKAAMDKNDAVQRNHQYTWIEELEYADEQSGFLRKLQHQ
jgi:hypothetical protein